MPRSAKSQADKSGRRPSVQVTPAQEAPTEEFIGGHLTQNQWIDMLKHEEAEETVGEIMDEVMSKVMDGCFKVYIEKQMAPYSALWAITRLTEIVTQQFLCRDEGEKSEEASKTEDSEPLPAIPDSWAQGCVPILYLISKQEENITELPEETEPREQQHLMAQKRIRPKPSVKDMTPMNLVCERSFRPYVPRPPPNITQKNKPEYLLSRPVLSKALPSLSRSSEKKVMKTDAEVHSTVHDQLPKLVTQHKEQKVIPKLLYSQLPRHFITPKYEIVDDSNSKNISKKASRDSKLEQRRKKQETEWDVLSQKSVTTYVDQQSMREGMTWKF